MTGYVKTLTERVRISQVFGKRHFACRTLTEFISTGQSGIVDRRVSFSLDDYVCLYTGTHSHFASGSYVAAGRYSATGRYYSGMRFASIAVPNGATVIVAKLYLVSRITTGDVVVRTKISAHDSDNSPMLNPGNPGDYHRTKTTAVVDWNNIPVWTEGVEYASPDIKTVIQGIVNRPGWTPGSAITIYWDDWGLLSDIIAFRYGRTFNEFPDSAARLYIEFEYFGDSLTATRTRIRTYIEGLGLASSIVKVRTYTKALTESVLLTASLLFPFRLILIESITLTQSFFNAHRQWYKTLSEGITLTTQLIKGPWKWLAETLSEAVTLTDSVTKNPAHIVTNTITLSDAISRGRHKALSEVVSLASGMTKSLSRVCTEYWITLTAAISKNPSRRLSQTVGLSDSIRRSTTRTITNTITLTDSVRKATSRVITQLLSLVDMIFGIPIRRLSLSSTIRPYRRLSSSFRQHRKLSSTTRGGGV